MFKFIGESQSQSGQESFVLGVLGEKTNGWYLEIGGFDAKDLSNTYLLEKKYGWNGVAVEIDAVRAKKYNKKRKNICLEADAVELDYAKMLRDYNFPKQIDYLQVDIEPASNSWKALQQLPLEEYRFSVITFEHDLYAHTRNLAIKNECFELLTSMGYQRIVSNVMNEGNPFEDWYVDKSSVKQEILDSTELRDLDYRSIFLP